MKKTSKPQPKEKPFSVSPFRELKGVKVETQAPPPQQPVPEAVPVATEPDDADLFLRAMSGVKQMDTPQPAAKATPQRSPVPRRIDEEERRVFLDALEKLQLDVTFADSLPDDVEPLRPLPVNRMRQLRRGAIRIDYELDLHGLSREEALAGLDAFIRGAFRRGQKAVLIITGKGNNSPGEPVLLGAVAGWLRNQGKGMVAEFSPAPRQMGGGGALVVFIKESKVDSESSPA
jgi:DNA-nicking Smr family endonuclease